MSWLFWLIPYAALVSALWAAGAFLFGLRHLGRLVLTLASPAVLCGCLCWFAYLAESDGRIDSWAPVFFVLSIMVGSVAAVVALPVWFILEERLGWRAR